jgi:glycosyltransferase involved in cell wall biosynthesis
MKSFLLDFIQPFKKNITPLQKETPQKNHVCFLISTLNAGGAERVCVTFANKLLDKGCSVAVVTLDDGSGVFASLVDERVAISSLGTFRTRSSLLSLFRYFREDQPSAVICFGAEITIAAILFKKIFNSNIKVISRSTTNFSEAKKFNRSFKKIIFYDFLFKCLYRFSDHIVAQTNDMRSDLVSNYSVSRDRISVIYNPLPPADNKLSYPKLEGKYVLCVGRLHPVKAFDLAISAFSVLLSVPRYESFQLKILGEGCERTVLEKKIADLGISANVVFEGFSEQVETFYDNAAFTLLTSVYEGCPNVMIESLALGTPVVSTDFRSGPREIIIEGVNGYIANERNPYSIAVAMIRALETTFDRSEVKKSVNRFSADASTNRLLEIIQS